MSASSTRPGHAPAPSVANAAALFGTDGDDPFAAIAEAPEEEAEVAAAPPVQAAPAPAQPAKTQHAHSPTALFGDSGGDDWLAGGAQPDQPEQAQQWDYSQQGYDQAQYGYGAQGDAAQQPDYSAQQGYDPQQTYQPQPGYEAQQGYETQQGYAYDQGYQQGDGYTQSQDYAQGQGYEQQGQGYEQGQGYDPSQGYDYSAQPQEQGGYEQQAAYGYAPDQNYAGSYGASAAHVPPPAPAAAPPPQAQSGGYAYDAPPAVGFGTGPRRARGAQSQAQYYGQSQGYAPQTEQYGGQQEQYGTQPQQADQGWSGEQNYAYTNGYDQQGQYQQQPGQSYDAAGHGAGQYDSTGYAAAGYGADQAQGYQPHAESYSQAGSHEQYGESGAHEGYGQAHDQAQPAQGYAAYDSSQAAHDGAAYEQQHADYDGAGQGAYGAYGAQGSQFGQDYAQGFDAAAEDPEGGAALPDSDAPTPRAQLEGPPRSAPDGAAAEGSAAAATNGTDGEIGFSQGDNAESGWHTGDDVGATDSEPPRNSWIGGLEEAASADVSLAGPDTLSPSGEEQAREVPSLLVTPTTEDDRPPSAGTARAGSIDAGATPPASARTVSLPAADQRTTQPHADAQAQDDVGGAVAALEELDLSGRADDEAAELTAAPDSHTETLPDTDPESAQQWPAREDGAGEHDRDAYSSVDTYRAHDDRARDDFDPEGGANGFQSHVPTGEGQTYDAEGGFAASEEMYPSGAAFDGAMAQAPAHGEDGGYGGYAASEAGYGAYAGNVPDEGSQNGAAPNDFTAPYAAGPSSAGEQYGAQESYGQYDAAPSSYAPQDYGYAAEGGNGAQAAPHIEDPYAPAGAAEGALAPQAAADDPYAPREQANSAYASQDLGGSRQTSDDVYGAPSAYEQADSNGLSAPAPYAAGPSWGASVEGGGASSGFSTLGGGNEGYQQFGPPTPPAPASAMSWTGVSSPYSPTEEAPQQTPDGFALGRSGTVTQRSFSNLNVRSAPPGASSSYLSLQQHAGNLAPASSEYGPPTSYAGSSYSQHSRGPSAQAPDAAEERRNVRIAVASFSFDGKLVTFFPGASDPASSSGGYAFGGAAPSTSVHVRPLSGVVPSHTYGTALDIKRFPGPALDGPGGAGAGGALSRATGGPTAGNKAKKAALIAFLNEAIAEVQRGVGYLRRRPSFMNGSAALVAGDPHAEDGAWEAQHVEDRITMMRLLVLMLEHDGNVTANPAFDAATRALLQSESAEETHAAVAVTPASDNVLQTYTLRASFLDRMQELLLAGERREAVQLAITEQMWAHALTIASCVDKELWRSVVDQFMQHELAEDAPRDGLPGAAAGSNRQSLRIAYALFSGQAPTAITDAFRPKTSLMAPQAGLPSSPGGASTLSALAGAAPKVPQWRQAAATIIANRTSGDAIALTAMGDGLLQAGWTEAAHICYLLSPQSATFDGVDGSGARLSLLGSSSPAASNVYLRDIDHILLSEIYEFIGALRPVAKGGETYHGAPHMQAFRLVHAYRLAELGDARGAQKYCEAIAAALKGGRMSRYYHHTLLAQVKELSDRIVGAPQVDAGGSWVSRKIQRPTMDGMWGALEGRFTKFIAGEDIDAATPAGSKAAASKAPPTGAVGPFSHYSSITPDSMSTAVSRAQSTADFHSGSGFTPAHFTGSQPSSRAASAADFHTRESSPHPSSMSEMTPLATSRDPYTDWPQPQAQADSSRGMTRSPAPYSSDRSSEGAYGGPYTSHSSANAPWPGSSGGEDGDAAPQPAEEPYYGYQPHGAQQPQFFSNVGDGVELNEEGGFISTFDALGGSTPQPAPQASYTPRQEQPAEEEDEEDDLGFGNASTQKAKQAREAAAAAAAAAPAGADKNAKAAPASDSGKESESKPQEEAKPAAGGSWLGRLWGGGGKKEAEPKAKKAHLGEESVFYFDKDLKRWVNKKAGDTGAAATPPPPPPRAQTASPSTGTGSAASLRRTSSDVPSGPPAAASSGYSGAGPSGSARSTPPISEEGGAPSFSSSLSPPPGPPGMRGAMPRARSNLGDLSQPPAAQPPMPRAASAVNLSGPPPPSSGTPPIPGDAPTPPPGAGSKGKKKRPITSRYVPIPP